MFSEQLQNEVILVTEGNLSPQKSFADFQRKLGDLVNDLVEHDFERLVHILYRVDVSEKKLKEILAASPSADAGYLIAGMIIERQAEKIKTRSQYRQNSNDIDEEDRW
jgi:hypothetical protein